MTDRTPPRICFVAAEWPPEPGGVGKSARRIVTRLITDGFTVHVFKPSPGASGPYRLESALIDGIWIHSVAPSLSDAFAAAIGRIDKDVHFDLFHGFYLPLAHPCLTVARNRPVIGSIRGADGMNVNHPMMRLVLEHAAWITSVSQESLRRATEIVDISNRCSWIPNSIDLRDVAKWSPGPANAGRVGTAATFRPKKNIPLLIQGYARVPASLRRELLLVGDFIVDNQVDEALRAEALATAGQNGVASEMRITGYVDEPHVHEYLRSMRVFALTSNHEGLPNSVLEAAAIGLPIIATAVDGIRDVFADEQDALLTPPGDPERVGAALERVLRDQDLCMNLSRGALRTAAGLSPEREHLAYVELYHRVLWDTGWGPGTQPRVSYL